MTDFAFARLNMVESQIRTNKVSDERLLEALESVPRELFVPDELRGIAYVDEDISIGHGRHLMQPMVLARLLQSAAPGPGDMVLDIACASGYSTAVLARLAATVAAVESEAVLVEKGNQILNDLGIDNAVMVEGELKAGYSKQAPYDVILLGGGVAEVPTEITDQLAEGGRLVTVVMEENGLGRATLMQRNGSVVSSRVIFDAAVPLLSEFAKAPGFVF
jgi:protein-L-isoaspartate(D-aspartate) O-methyltransferase